MSNATGLLYPFLSLSLCLFFFCARNATTNGEPIRFRTLQSRLYCFPFAFVLHVAFLHARNIKNGISFVSCGIKKKIECVFIFMRIPLSHRYRISVISAGVAGTRMDEKKNKSKTKKRRRETGRKRGKRISGGEKVSGSSGKSARSEAARKLHRHSRRTQLQSGNLFV